MVPVEQKKSEKVAHYAKLQYQSTENLTKRQTLWTFGDNPISLSDWIFRTLKLTANEKVLELGGGPGSMWCNNQSAIPAGVSLVFTDFSDAMVEKAGQNFQKHGFYPKIMQMDAQRISFPDHSFDLVIGCHMLYHVPHIPTALAEIRRVLRPQGRFIATTVARVHTKELRDFLAQFDLDMEKKTSLFSEFFCENAREVLSPFFTNIELHEYRNNVVISDQEIILSYIDSMFPIGQYPQYPGIRPNIEQKLEEIWQREGKFQITGKMCLIVGHLI